MVQRCLHVLHFRQRWSQISTLAIFDLKHENDIVLVFPIGEAGEEMLEAKGN